LVEHPAVNTSPLIFFTKGGFLDLLHIVSPKIIVPVAVASEIQAYGETDVTAVALKNTQWLVV
jgi:predicted nucleic acid-binding protein